MLLVSLNVILSQSALLSFFLEVISGLLAFKYTGCLGINSDRVLSVFIVSPSLKLIS